ncbi:hypothetical protein BKA66DRAFT_514685 [Pyrenochaeta sp. MPI-SDFR-AT-0127]|nr:hypothetical protein BKA66DRAFT_514685 [Pyrenochaeta sp. MPI-SDFR-AT-0127]
MTLTLYDLPTRGRRACWAFNPWRTRMLLQYKSIDFKTEWLEYPDIAPTLQSFGLPPSHGGVAPYTVPTIRLPSGVYIMDSYKIALEVEKLYPSPSSYLDTDIVHRLNDLVTQIVTALSPVHIPRIPHLLSDESCRYFVETREKRFGPLEKLGEKAGKQMWDAAHVQLDEAAKLLAECNGPFFLGDKVSYADFVFVSFLQFAKVVSQDLFESITRRHTSFADLYHACDKWLAQDY